MDDISAAKQLFQLLKAKFSPRPLDLAEQYASGPAVDALVGAQILPQQKSSYERTLAPGEWEQMSSEERTNRVRDMLGEVALSAVDPIYPGAPLRGLRSAEAIGAMRGAAPAGRPSPRGGDEALKTEYVITMSEPEPPNAGPDWYPKEFEVGTVRALGDKEALEIAKKKFGKGAAIAGEVDELRKSAPRPGVRKAKEPTVELRNDPFENNASAGGAGSLEESRRNQALARKGITRVVKDRAGRFRPAHVDYQPRPGEQVGELDANGMFWPY